MPSILDEIVTAKRVELAESKAQVTLGDLEKAAAAQPRPLNLSGALLGGGVRLIAEVKGPNDEIVAGIKGLSGVTELHSEQNNGWTRLTLSTSSDLREEIYKLSARKKWSIRELRREVATLEDYFVKIVAEAQ